MDINKKHILYIFIILLLIVSMELISSAYTAKDTSNNVNNKEIIYNQSATCYGNIGDMVVQVNGNDEETKVVGRIIKHESTASWVNDKMDDYTSIIVEEDIREILNRQSEELDYFNIKQIDGYRTNIRNDINTYDTYDFEINYEYKVKKSFNEYINSLENATNYEDKYSCIIDDDKEIIGVWHGVDNNFVYKYKYNIEVSLGKNNEGVLLATDFETNEPYKDKRFIKYNLLDNNKIKIAYYTKSKINDIEYIDYLYTTEYLIKDENLSYRNFGEIIILEKEN